MRALLILIPLLLVGCSYDPYHYYYDCEGTNGSDDPNKRTFYLHNKIITDNMNRKHELVSETSQNIKYQLDDVVFSYEININKVNNSIETVLLGSEIKRLGSYDYDCSVTKRLTPL
jgi:hypothetical protein